MPPFEEYIDYISREISINENDREIYTKDFDRIRDYILKIMCWENSVFEALYKGPSLFGSHSNNVRLHYPDEFDVHVMLKPRFAEHIEVEYDEDRPGYVNLNFEKVLEKLYDSNSIDIYNQLYNMTDNKYYLVRGRVQRWLEEIIENALDANGNQVRGYWGDFYTIEYSKRGLAHTIFAHCEYRKISIDLVPAFICGEWMALPKPTRGPIYNRRIAFMICNPDDEHDMLLNKYNLKPVFRLLKSLRNEYGLKRIKSYFIATLFLWEIDEQDESFWRYSIDYLFIHMLGKLTDAFTDETLPFFWDSDLNLLDILYAEEITSYANTLVSVYNRLSSYVDQPNIKYATVAYHFDVD